MTIQEKIAEKDRKLVRLYKEGIFWIAYESDAYLISQVKTLKPTKKYVKTVRQEVVRVGFPHSSLEGILHHFTLLQQEDTFIEMESAEAVDMPAFETWKGQMALSTATITQDVPGEIKTNNTAQLLFDRLRSFRLYTASPMDCMRFIEELQSEFC